MIQLSDNQSALIRLAIETGGRIETFPDNLRGGARVAVVRALVLQDLIANDGVGYALTDAGYKSVGHWPPNTAADPAHGRSTPNSGAAARQAPTTRKEGRTEQVVALLKRPKGATITQVMEVTQWQQHSVRGFFAGALKKKGYELSSEKDGKQARVYRIKSEATAPTQVASDEEQ